MFNTSFVLLRLIWKSFVLFVEVLKGFLNFFSFQSLFNLLEFRRLVLNFNPPANAQDLPRNQKVKQEADFLLWLMRAFLSCS